MVHFTCSRCGKCCQSFGPYLRIEQELERGRYYCHCSLSGEYFFARISGDLDSDFLEDRPVSTGPSPCPFLFQERSGAYTCAIYPSRPAFCRAYRCSRMDILDADGLRRGRVGGRRSLISTDGDLNHVWQTEIKSMTEENDEIWQEKVRGILEKNGYRVVVYE